MSPVLILDCRTILCSANPQGQQPTGRRWYKSSRPNRGGRSWVYPIGYGGVNRRPVYICTLKIEQRSQKSQTFGIFPPLGIKKNPDAETDTGAV